MSDLIYDILSDLKAGKALALATILNRNGSTPRTAGAEMIVHEDGSIAGTVGGGQLEAEIIQLGKQVLQTGQGQIREFHLTGKDAASTDMICGGNQEILVEKLDPQDPAWLEQYQLLADAIHDRKRAWWITPLPHGGKHSAWVAEGGGFLHPGMDVRLADQDEARLQIGNIPIDLKQVHTAQMLQTSGGNYFINPIGPYGALYLFGGGHVAVQVAKVASLVGFRLTVLDDREEFITPERFPMADERVLLPEFDGCFERLTVDENSYLVIVTRGHLNDQLVLEGALKTQAAYIGMIGSKRKCQAIFTALLAKGVSQAAIQRVHAPIGIEIEAESPEEIAVSITAELIQVRSRWLKASQ